VAELRWTIGARGDLREIVEYIGADSPTCAAVTAHRLITATERLQKHPRLGIVAIVHGSQDLLRTLGDRP